MFKLPPFRLRLSALEKRILVYLSLFLAAVGAVEGISLIVLYGGTEKHRIHKSVESFVKAGVQSKSRDSFAGSDLTIKFIEEATGSALCYLAVYQKDEERFRATGEWGTLKAGEVPLTGIEFTDNARWGSIEGWEVFTYPLNDGQWLLLILPAIAKGHYAPFFIVWIILVFVELIMSIILGRGVLDAVAPVSQQACQALNAELASARNILKSAQEKWEQVVLERQNRKYQFKSTLEETIVLVRQFQKDLKEILAQLGKISASLEHQTGNVRQMTASLSDLSESVKSAESLSDSAVASSKASEGDAKRGFEVVNKIIKHMNRIIQTVSRSADVIRDLTKRSEEIVQIIRVIDDIAEQTNLLALNAAIEAARAGPQGRGFAVVADQVRSLAEKTTHATKEIGATLSSIQEETARAVAAMNEGVKEIDIGQGFAVQAGVNLRKIVAGTQNVSKVISKIAEASQRQSQSSADINRSVSEASHEADSTWEESKAALLGAQELEKRIQKLSLLMDGFLSLGSSPHGEDEWIVLGASTTKEMLLRNRRLKDIFLTVDRLSRKP